MRAHIYTSTRHYNHAHTTGVGAYTDAVDVNNSKSILNEKLFWIFSNCLHLTVDVLFESVIYDCVGFS